MKKTLYLLLTAASLAACSRIDTGEVGIETTNGKVSTGALSPGLYFYMPIFSSMHILNTKVQTVAQDSQGASKDLQNVQTQITLNYHLGATDPISHYSRLGDDQTLVENTIVKPAMSEAFKSVVAQYTAEELITKRALVSLTVESTLSDRLKQYDLFIDSVSITNFEFSKAFSEAIEAKQVAEQNANKAKNDLARIQVEAQQQIVEAQAKAQAMTSQKQAISPELLQLKLIEKWDGHYPTTYMGATPNLMLNMGINK